MMKIIEKMECELMREFGTLINGGSLNNIPRNSAETMAELHHIRKQTQVWVPLPIPSR